MTKRQNPDVFILMFIFPTDMARITFDTIKIEEWANLMHMTKKRCKQIDNLFRSVSCPSNIEDFDQLLTFCQTGLFPSAKVIRSQVDKIKRLYVWMMSALYYDILVEEVYNKFYSECDRLLETFPYLKSHLIELGIYQEK